MTPTKNPNKYFMADILRNQKNESNQQTPFDVFQNIKTVKLIHHGGHGEHGEKAGLFFFSVLSVRSVVN